MNTIIDEYKTLAREGHAKLKVKGSVFQAIAVPVKDCEVADRILESWRKSFHDSTHICWARRLAPPPDAETRIDDDGEPPGTAGNPILRAVLSNDLWGVQIGVVRWFGGTKLGTGGLARAYGGVAAEAIDNSKIKLVEIKGKILVAIPIEYQGVVYSLADKLGAVPEPPEYDENGMKLVIKIRLSMSEKFQEQLIESTAGVARIKTI